MSTNKYIQQLLVKGFIFSLLLCGATALHAQQNPIPDMTKFTKAPIAPSNGSASAARTTAAPARTSATLPSDQPAQATGTDNSRTIKSANRTTTVTPAGPGMEQMNMQPTPERAKPKQEPVKTPTQQN